MNIRTISPFSFIAVATGLFAALAFTARAGEFNDRAQHAEGLASFMAEALGHGHEDVARIEIVPGATARILTAHAVARDRGVKVYGTLQPLAQLSRGSGAHVHALVIGANGTTLAEASATYLVPPDSFRLRSSLRPRARFAVELPTLAAGSYIRVVHHGMAESRCGGGA